MKVVGIIAEYNPFHNGHAYQIQQIREQLKADYVIVAMSGDFVQRGIPAITDKYTRTSMAISGGADVVFELPCIWATSSAEFFARAGVTLLANTGVVDTLCFGAETDNIDSLKAIASALSEENAFFSKKLADYIANGNSYPSARSLALKECLNLPDIEEILNQPNNILGIEYLKALNSSSIQPHIIRREGDDYHAKNVSSPNTSATAIREKLLSKDLSAISECIPKASYDVFLGSIERNQILFDNAISSVIGYALLCKNGKYEDYVDCSRELADKIRNNINDYKDFHSFCSLLKTKEITYSRISRTLLHIALGHTKKDTEIFKEVGYIPYLRLLGFKKESSGILSEIKSKAKVPIISKVADASEYLVTDAMKLLDSDIFASNLYNQLMYTQNDIQLPNDYQHPIVIK